MSPFCTSRATALAVAATSKSAVAVLASTLGTLFVYGLGGFISVLLPEVVFGGGGGRGAGAGEVLVEAPIEKEHHAH